MGRTATPTAAPAKGICASRASTRRFPETVARFRSPSLWSFEHSRRPLIADPEVRRRLATRIAQHRGEREVSEVVARPAVIRVDAATKITGHRSESVYRRYAIVSDSDLQDAAAKLAASAAGTITGTIAASGRKHLR